jgi:CDP-glucose 4,6-dehydratase
MQGSKTTMAGLVKLNRDFWKDRRVVLTGHTGFKGSWMALWLTYLGAKVYGYSLSANTEPSMFNLCGIHNRIVLSYCCNNVKDIIALKAFIGEVNPSIIIHMAAQPLVSESYLDPINTFTTNTIGTLNVLEAARTLKSLDAIEIITTDKCYKITKTTNYSENDLLGGRDPYSASKACAELVVDCYRQSFFDTVPIITVRAGNVIGGGDWGKDRLVTDALSSIKFNKPLQLRQPYAVRPWQHILNVIYCYLRLVEESGKMGISGPWNVGPYDGNIIVSECIEAFFKLYGKGSWEVVPEQFPETQILRLDNTKITRIIGQDFWFGLEKMMKLTVDWYKKFDEGANMFDITMSQIIDYDK